MRIDYVKSGVANRYKDRIEINENLKKYKGLHDSILNHELNHTDKPFTKKDFLLDFSSNDVNSLDLILFMIRHPKSLSQVLPIQIKKEIMFYDVNSILFILIMLISVGLGIFIGVGI